MKVLFSIINANVSRSQKHNHDCLEIVYRLAGNSHTTIGNQTHFITTGDLYLVPSKTFHQDVSQELFSDLVIHVEYPAISDILVVRDQETYISSLVKMIYRIMCKKEFNYQDIANSLMQSLFQYLKRFFVLENRSPYIEKLKNIIFENFENSDFDLTKEIKNMGYHIDYIRRRFKLETQTTPQSYLTDLRINHAKHLLVMHTCESIENISEKCGFKDSFYFSSCFKKHVGLSPLQYRKQNLLKH